MPKPDEVPADDDLWRQLALEGALAPTEDVYAHGYARRVRGDLVRHLVFRVGPEWYALPIECVEEIAKLFDTTLVPHTAPFVVGIGNVRGRVMPVVDLATRLGLTSHVRGAESRMVIVRHREEPYALVVDEVRNVLPLAPESFEPPPATMGGEQQRFIANLVRNEMGLLIVLELDALLAAEDFVALGKERSR